MRVAVIENRLKDYVIDIFHRHSPSEVELAAFLEWKPQQKMYQEVPVEKIEELDNGQYDTILVAIRENRYLSRLLTYLHKKHIRNLYVVRLFTLDQKENFIVEKFPYFDNRCIDKIPSEHEKPYMVHLETHVCDHCNLNCKACNNFSPFVKEPSYADIDQFERDLNRLTELFSGIGRFFLLGGEPLLAPELCCDMIRCFRKYFPTNELRVLTNATLILSMKDTFWNCIRENDAIIHISLYPPVKDKIVQIRERLEKNRVKYIVFKEVESFIKHWTAYSIEDAKYNNERCGSGGCHYLRNGEISKCPDSILIDFMTKKDKSLSFMRSKDRINLLDEYDAWEMIEKLDNSIDMCMNCTYRRLEVVSWKPVVKEAQTSDWLLPNRYETEIERLKKDNEKVFDEIKRVKEEIKALNRIIEEQDEQIHLDKEIISTYEARENGLKKELGMWKKKYDIAVNCMKSTQQEYERVNNSYSHKIGKVITWLPRKVRKTIRKCVGGGYLIS